MKICVLIMLATYHSFIFLFINKCARWNLVKFTGGLKDFFVCDVEKLTF